jgi:hypothetical protein
MMTDDAFARIVAEDVKNKVSDTQASYLRLPENRDRWLAALDALSANLATQMADIMLANQAEVARFKHLGDDGVTLATEAEAIAEGRRKKIDRFKFFVDQRRTEAERLISTGGDVEARGSQADFLRSAIERHRELMREHDLEATPIDQALWDALSGTWSFDGISGDDVGDAIPDK